MRIYGTITMVNGDVKGFDGEADFGLKYTDIKNIEWKGGAETTYIHIEDYEGDDIVIHSGDEMKQFLRRYLL